MARRGMSAANKFTNWNAMLNVVAPAFMLMDAIRMAQIKLCVACAFSPAMASATSLFTARCFCSPSTNTDTL